MDLAAITTYQTLGRIARTCPRSLTTYIHLLCRADQEDKVVLEKKQITDDLSESFAKFRNDLRALAREDLLEWHQMGNFLHVVLASPGDLRDGA